MEISELRERADKLEKRVSELEGQKTAVAVAAPAAAPVPAPASGVVLVFKSEDCSGDAVRLTGSTARLEPGVRSFQVESGAPASAWAQADYAGPHTEPVGPSMCISPGFEIGSVRLK